MPLFSIIMPIYNRQDYLKRSISSVISQSFYDWELLLVDDGSTDSSYEVCQNYAKADCRIRLFRQENAGPGSARNRGIEEAAGDYILFLDSDDWYEDDCLEACSKEIEEKAPDVINFFMKEWHKDRTVINKRALLPTALSEMDKRLFLMSRDISVGTRAVRKSLFIDHNIRFPNWPTSEDLLVMLLVYAVADSVIQINKAFYNYDKTVSVSATKSVENGNDYLMSIPYNTKEEFVNREIYEQYEYPIKKAFLTDVKYSVFLSDGNAGAIDLLRIEYKKVSDDLYPEYFNAVNIRYLVFGSYTLRSAVQSIMFNAGSICHFQFESVISAMSNHDVSVGYTIGNTYREQMVIKELSGELLKCVQEGDYDYFVIDLLEERYNLLMYDGNFLTDSDALRDSNVDIHRYSRINRMDDSLISEFREGCIKLWAQLQKRELARKTIIVENYLMPGKGDFSLEMPFENLDMIIRTNALISAYYRELETVFTEAIVIKPHTGDVNAFSDNNYRHGCAPYHTYEAWESRIGDMILRHIITR